MRPGMGIRTMAAASTDGELQQPLPGAVPGEKWVPAERIYALSEQP